MKISQAEYERIFKSIAHLYGIATNENVDMIIDHYYVDVDKNDTLLALEKFNKKHRKKYFRVERIGDNRFMLISDFLDKDEDVVRVNALASRASFYFPPSKADFLAYEEDFYCDEGEDRCNTEFMHFIYKYSNIKDDKNERAVRSFMTTLYCQMKIRSSSFDECIYDLLDSLGFSFNTKYSQKKLERIYCDMLMNTRLYIHRGHKVIELSNDEMSEAEKELVDLNDEEGEAKSQQKEHAFEEIGKKIKKENRA